MSSDEIAHLIADNRHGFPWFQSMTGRSSLEPPVTPLWIILRQKFDVRLESMRNRILEPVPIYSVLCWCWNQTIPLWSSFRSVVCVVDFLHLRRLFDEQYGSFCRQEMDHFYILVTKGGSRWRMVFALFMKEMAAQTGAAASLSLQSCLLSPPPPCGITLAKIVGETNT